MKFLTSLAWQHRRGTVAGRNLCFLLFFFCIVPQPASAGEQLVFSYRFGPPSIQQKTDGSWVTIPGLPSSGDPGQPILPVYTAFILLPPGHNVLEVHVSPAAKITLPGEFRIPHGQTQFPLNTHTDWQPTPADEGIYSSPDAFPSQPHRLLGTWTFCGYNILLVNLFPVEYRPASGTISYCPEMELRLQTASSGDALESTRKMLRPSETTSRRLAHLVDNPEQAAAYRSLSVSQEHPKRTLVNASETYPYVIVTDAILLAPFQTLAEFKTQRGQRANVVTIQDIAAHYAGLDLAQQIRNFILDAYAGWQTDFVLLGGDDEIIPHRGLYAEAFGYTDFDIPADLYYGALDGSWNDDGDQLWGEPGEEDLFPEVSVGRAPVDDEDEALQFVLKTIRYQQAPVLEQTTGALMVGEQMWDIPLTYGGDYKDEIRFGSTANSCTTAGFPAHFDVGTLYDRDLGSPWWGGTLRSLMNDGLHLINHLGHTQVERALRTTADQIDDELTNDGVDNSYFIIFSQGCYAASFDNRNPEGLYLDDCIAEAFLTGPHGAVAFVGNSRYGWASAGGTDGASQYFDRQFFDALFGEQVYQLGCINDDSRLDNLWALGYEGIRWCYYEQNLLGDPELDLWTEVPETLTVLHPDVITIDEDNAVTVVAQSGGSGLPGALVCIRQGEDVYQTGITDGLGMASFSLNPATPETLSVSVTAHNYLPYGGAMLARADGPSLWYSQHLIDDDRIDGSWGNGDGIINQGEKIDLTIWLRNFGNETAQEISATLCTADSYVTIVDSVRTFPDIPPEGEQVCSEGYLFTVSGACPDSHHIEFTLVASDGVEELGYSSFSTRIAAPRLSFENLTLSDEPPYGNGNGILEADESALMMVTIRNSGSGKAMRTQGQLSLQGEDPYVAIDRGFAFFGGIEGGAAASGFPIYKVTASAESPAVHFLDYTLDLTAGGDYWKQDSVPHALGPTGLRDDMEGYTANWTPGDLWHLTPSRPHSPHQAWHGALDTLEGALDENDASLTSSRIYLISGSVLDFWHWYDLEEDEDFGYVELFAGTDWIPLSQPFTGASGGWVRETIDLREYPSGSAVQVRFRLSSDGESSGQGWYIDDVFIGPPLRFVMAQAQVSPQRGTQDSVFTFSAVYISDRNYPPTTAVVSIDGVRYAMSSSEDDYAQGATFAYQTPLSLGEHQYYFEFRSDFETVRWPSLSEYFGPLVTEAIYQEDFEDGNGGFTVTGPDWEWGPPSSGPQAAHSGQNVWATILAGTYSNSSDSRLETPPIDLTGVANSRLSFWHWYCFDFRSANYDGANVKVSTDGGQNFQIITPEDGYEGIISIITAGIPEEPGFCSYDAGQFWHQEIFDLSGYDGQQIIIRFHFGSNSKNTYPGWYIDDVAVTGLRQGDLPTVSDLNLNLSGNDVVLSWSWPHDQDPAEYAVYRSIFSNGTIAEPESIGAVVDTFFTDHAAAGDSAVNYFYFVQALGFDGQKSDPSHKVGEFDLPIRRPLPPDSGRPYPPSKATRHSP